MPSGAPDTEDDNLIIWLDPAEASCGTTTTLTLPADGDAAPRTLVVNIPPGVRNGTLLTLPGVAGPDGEGRELFVRVRVRWLAKSNRLPVASGSILALIVVLVVLFDVHSHSPAGSDAAASASASVEQSVSDSTPATSEYQPSTSYQAPGAQPSSAGTDSSAEESVPAIPVTQGGYDPGICPTGTLPDSTVATPVSSDVTEVSCDTTDAHYQVIQSFPGTTDMSVCDNNSRTQYEFSDEETINDVPVTQYVYCLVGLGSYAR